MNSRQPPADDATVTPLSTCRSLEQTPTVSAPSSSRSQATPRDVLCKLAFLDVDVAKTTPGTSCRSVASSDSDNESVTSPVMASSSMTSPASRDEDGVPASSASTWSTYAYFYPRHDMTYTHCLLTTSRRVHCDRMSSTSVCWPSLPGEDDIPTGAGQWRPETVSCGADSRWRRRVNAAGTPFWFPVARSYDAAPPAYLCYPRHDLSYAEVEASRVDRQPGVEHSSLPFSTILEELATDDASDDEDDNLYVEDRRSVVDDDNDMTSVGPTRPARSAARDDLRYTTSDDELKQRAALSRCCYDDVDHEVTSSDRWTTVRHQSVDTILTPVTKLDLRSLEVVTCRQRVVEGAGRARPVVGSPAVAAEKVRLRRCSSDPAVKAAGRQSPVRDLPLSARVVKLRNRFGAAAADDDDGFEDVTADGDQASCSPPSVVPLRAKHAVTCLVLDRQLQSFNCS